MIRERTTMERKFVRMIDRKAFCSAKKFSSNKFVELKLNIDDRTESMKTRTRRRTTKGLVDINPNEMHSGRGEKLFARNFDYYHHLAFSDKKFSNAFRNLLFRHLSIFDSVRRGWSRSSHYNAFESTHLILFFFLLMAFRPADVSTHLLSSSWAITKTKSFDAGSKKIRKKFFLAMRGKLLNNLDFSGNIQQNSTDERWNRLMSWYLIETFMGNYSPSVSTFRKGV